MGRITGTMKRTLAGVLAALLVVTSLQTDVLAEEVVMDEYALLEAADEEAAVEDALDIEAEEVTEEAIAEETVAEEVEEVAEDVEALSAEPKEYTITIKTQKGRFSFDQLISEKEDPVWWDYSSDREVKCDYGINNTEFYISVEEGTTVSVNMANIINNYLYYNGSYDAKDYSVTPANAYERRGNIFTFNSISEDIIVEKVYEPYGGKNPEGLWIKGFEGKMNYCGYNLEQNYMEVYWNDTLLSPNVDYTLSYKNNKNVSTAKKKATVTIKGKGNYKFKTPFTYDIVPCELNTLNYEVSVNSTQAKKYNPLVNNTTYKLGKDYTLSVEGGKQNSKKPVKVEGTKMVSVNFIGNYKGTWNYKVTATDTLTDYSKAKVSLERKSFTWTGENPELKVKKISGVRNATVSENTRIFVEHVPKFVGKHTAYIVIADKEALADYNNFDLYYDFTSSVKNDNYKVVKITFTIKPSKKLNSKNVKFAKSLSKLVYNGENQFNPEALVSFSGAVSKNDIEDIRLYKYDKYFKDYDYVFDDQAISAGKYKIVVSPNLFNGVGGEVSKTFTIKPYDIKKDTDKVISINMINDTVSYNAVCKEDKDIYLYTADRLECEATSKYEGGEFCSYDVSLKNASKVTDNAKLVFKGTGNYKGTVTKKFKIKPTNLSDDYSGIVCTVASSTAKNYKKAPKVLYQFTYPVSTKDYRAIKYYTISENKAYKEIKKAKDITDVSANEIIVMIEGKNNFEGTCEARMKIVSDSKDEGKNIGNFKYAKISLPYTGTIQTVSAGDIKIKSPENMDVKKCIDLDLLALEKINWYSGTKTIMVRANEDNGYIGYAKIKVTVAKCTQEPKKVDPSSLKKSFLGVLDSLLDLFN